MQSRCRWIAVFFSTLAWLMSGVSVGAQETPMVMPMSTRWQFMTDGRIIAELDHQGGRRGGDQVVAPNWWMGMVGKSDARWSLTFTGMFSLEPATVGTSGYRELFQAGEAFHGHPIIDRQHPHDFFMQLGAIGRVQVNKTTGLTLVAAPVGEPALGPVAFMHRASAIDNPTAPLTHHTFDSTHISFGLVTAALDRGRWVLEGSIFNGREPDENRWNFDFGRLDSVSGRLWFKPTARWEFQVSTGHLKDPEQLQPGNVERTTASGSWTHVSGSNVSAVTFGYGQNDTDHGTRRATFVEAARHARSTTIYSRIEGLQVETALLQTDVIAEGPAAAQKDPLYALTIGGVRDLLTAAGMTGGFGADVTLYRLPASLDQAYGAHPVSLHVFFRLLLPTGSGGRMWNMRMSQPMTGHTGMSMPMPGL